MRRLSKIQEYDQKAPSKQAVGVPIENHSGQIIAQGIMNFANALKEREKKIAEREDKANTVAANAKMGDYILDYENKKVELQKTYQDKPKEYAAAVKNEGDKLVNAHSKGLSTGVAEKFKAYTTNLLTQDVDNNVDWGIQRDKQIIQSNIQKSLGDLTLAAETATTPEQMNQILGNLAYLKNVHSAFLRPDENDKYTEDTRKLIIRNSIDAAILKDSRKTYAELSKDEKSKYAPYLNPTELLRYKAEARNKLITQTTEEQFNSLATAAVELSNLIDDIDAGKSTVGDVSRRLMWAQLNSKSLDDNGQPKISQDYIRGLEQAHDRALGLRGYSKDRIKGNEKAFIEKFEAKWDTFLTGKKKNSKATAKDFDDVIGLYADLMEAHNNGIIDDATFADKKNVLNTKYKHALKPGTLLLDEALKKAGNQKQFWIFNKDDIYSAGYRKIKDYVKTRKDLTEEGKREARDLLLTEYTKTIQKYPPEQVAASDKIEALSNLVLKSDGGLIAQLGVYQHPDNPDIKVQVGDIITRANGKVQKVVGYNSVDNVLRVAPPKNAIKNLDNR